MSARPPHPQAHPQHRNPRRYQPRAHRPPQHHKKASTSSSQDQRSPDYPGHAWASSAIARARAELELSEQHALNSGHVSTFAGSGSFGHDDGNLKTASFIQPLYLAFSSDGSLFISERRHRIRKVTPDGQVTLYAGGSQPGKQDGPRLEAKFDRPHQLCFDANGFLYVCDTNNDCIRMIDTEMDMVTTFAGSTSGLVDGHRSVAQFVNPTGIAVSPSNELFISEPSSDTIRKIDCNGYVSTVIAGAKRLKPYIEFALHQPHGICFTPQGDLIVTDNLVVGRTHKFSLATKSVTSMPSSILRSVLGKASKQKAFLGSCSVVCSSTGETFLSEAETNTIYRFNGYEFIPYAGTTARGCTNGEPSAAQFSFPVGLAISPTDSDLYICDVDNHKIRKIFKAIEADFCTLSLRELLLRHGGSEDFSLTHQNSSQQWNLPQCIVMELVPRLVTHPAAKESIERLDCPSSSMEAFLLVLLGEPLDRAIRDSRARSTGVNASVRGIKNTVPFLQAVYDVYIIASLSGSDDIQYQCLQALREYVLIMENVTAEGFFQPIASLTRRFSCPVALSPLHLSKSPIESNEETPGYWCRVMLSEIFRDLYEAHISHLPDVGYRLILLVQMFSEAGLEEIGKSLCTEVSTTVRVPSAKSKPKVTASAQLLHRLYEFISSHQFGIVHTSTDPADTLSNKNPDPLPAHLLPNFKVECEGRTFWCHDWVLRARWPFFRRLLDFSGAEAQQHVLLLDCISSQAFYLLLRHIYTNNVSSLDLTEAEKWSKEELLEACTSLMEGAEFLGLFTVDRSTPTYHQVSQSSTPLKAELPPLDAKKLPTLVPGFERLVFFCLQYVVHNSTVENSVCGDIEPGYTPSRLLAHLSWTLKMSPCTEHP